MPNPFTSALLHCLFKAGVPLRSTILDTCTMLGKGEHPSCAIMKFPDVPLIPAFCEIIYVGGASPETGQVTVGTEDLTALFESNYCHVSAAIAQNSKGL